MSRGHEGYLSSGKGWTTELFFMFLTGFVTASLLWLAVWFFHSRPAQAAALQEHESVVESCILEKRQMQEAQESLRLEKEQTARKLEVVNRKLDDALVGWGRCIRGRKGLGE